MASPLVTIILLAYKQEHFIREAVESVLSQTYSPLEIILSDDFSPDRTFAIMQEMVAAYQGVHKVVLNRNPKNLGLGRHFNLLMDMAQGELIVAAAGDDISLPDRAAILTKEWLAHGRPSGICSGIIFIDENGKTIGGTSAHALQSAEIAVDFEWFANNQRMLNAVSMGKWALVFINKPVFSLPGCAAAWSGECWKAFGHIDPDAAEDKVMTFRAALLNGLKMLDRELVKYRHHTSNTWSPSGPKRCTSPEDYIRMETQKAYRSKMQSACYLNMLKDFQNPNIQTALDAGERSKIQKSIEDAYAITRLEGCWWELSLLQRLKEFRHAGEDALAVNLLKLLPLPLYAKSRAALAKVKRSFSAA